MIAEHAPYQPDRSPIAKFKRRLTQWRAAAPAKIKLDQPILSVTFDDFPQSAAHIGGEIVGDFGGRAGYYACTSMADTSNHMGAMFTREDLQTLHQQGHEIGSHTHTHLDCARASTDDAVADTERNLIALSALGHNKSVTSFAFPYGETRWATKRRLSENFDVLRGILPGINVGRVDRAQLRALQLDAEDWTIERARRAIELGAQKKAWVILFTHDVRNNHSDFGTSPDNLRALLKQAVDAGYAIETPSQAAQTAQLI